MDLRTLAPKPFITYFPGKIDQDKINVKVHMEDSSEPKLVTPIPRTEPHNMQHSHGPKTLTDLGSFGPIVKVALGESFTTAFLCLPLKSMERLLTLHTGKVVLARSGDKGGNANCGLWVRHDDEWPWLQSFLTVERFKGLLGNDYKSEYRIERCEMAKIRAVHFVVYGILEDGVSSSSLIDGFAKSFGEFIRARQVELPQKFFERSIL